MATQHWRRLIARFAASPEEVRRLLALIPPLYRRDREVLPGFQNIADPVQKRSEQLNFARRIWELLGVPGQPFEAALQECFELFQVLEQVPLGSLDRQRVMVSYIRQFWNADAVRNFVEVRRAVDEDPGGASGLAYTRWLLSEQFGGGGGPAFDYLLRHHPAFTRRPMDPAELLQLREAYARFLAWDHTRYRVRSPAGQLEEFPDPFEFGRSLEASARAEYDRLGQLAQNLDDLDTSAGKAAGSDWHWNGRNYRASANFPLADAVINVPGAPPVFAQIGHGTPDYLRGKFERILNVGGLDQEGLRAIEELQYLGRLPLGPQADRGTIDFARAALPEFRRRARLLVPESVVDGLRLRLAGDIAFEDWVRELQMSADELLGIIQPIPPGPLQAVP